MEEETAEQERIRREVLTRWGRPPRLDHLAIVPVDNSTYRVNAYVSSEKSEEIKGMKRLKIAASWYVLVKSSGFEFRPPLPEKKVDGGIIRETRKKLG